jgi:hypothetical protein
MVSAAQELLGKVMLEEVVMVQDPQHTEQAAAVEQVL